MTMDSDESAFLLPELARPLAALAGPHTQFACNCFYGNINGVFVPGILLVSCTQMFVSDADSFVVRVALIEKLLALYQRSFNVDEQEILFVFDGEHDLLVKGSLVCEGTPPKRLIPTVKALFAIHHHSETSIALHVGYTVALKDIAKLKPPATYLAPLPQKEEMFEKCPCWRQADVLNISQEEFLHRVRNMFIVYAPERLSLVGELCKKYTKKKGGALQFLVNKYGPEPNDEQARALFRMHMRDAKMNELLTSEGAVSGKDTVPLQTLISSQRSAVQSKLYGEQPLLYCTLLLTSQPSGGYARQHIKIKPKTMVPVQLQSKNTSCIFSFPKSVDELWYLCNERYVVPFTVSETVTRDVFGFRSGDRVLSTWGATRGAWSTVIGVKDALLWVHDDHSLGASALVGFRTKDELERYNGWVVYENIRHRLRHVQRMQILTGSSRTPTWIYINPEIVHARTAFFHNQCLMMDASLKGACTYPLPDWKVVMAGVSCEEENTLFAFFIDPLEDSVLDMSHLGENGRRITHSRVAAQQLVRCSSPEEVMAQFRWNTVGEGRVYHFSAEAFGAVLSTDGASVLDCGGYIGVSF